MSASFISLLKAGLRGGAIAAVINLILFEFASRVFGLEFNVVMAGKPDKVFELPVIMASIVPSAVASVLFYLLVKKTGQPVRIFKAVAMTVMLLSLLSPAMSAESPDMFVLVAMHIIVAYLVVSSLVKKVV